MISPTLDVPGVLELKNKVIIPIICMYIHKWNGCNWIFIVQPMALNYWCIKKMKIPDQIKSLLYTIYINGMTKNFTCESINSNLSF